MRRDSSSKVGPSTYLRHASADVSEEQPGSGYSKAAAIAVPDAKISSSTKSFQARATRPPLPSLAPPKMMQSTGCAFLSTRQKVSARRRDSKRAECRQPWRCERWSMDRPTSRAGDASAGRRLFQ